MGFTDTLYLPGTMIFLYFVASEPVDTGKLCIMLCMSVIMAYPGALPAFPLPPSSRVWAKVCILVFPAQGRLERVFLAAWARAAESSCLQREDLEYEVAQKANTRHLSAAFAGWVKLHHVSKQDAQRISFCTR